MSLIAFFHLIHHCAVSSSLVVVPPGRRPCLNLKTPSPRHWRLSCSSPGHLYSQAWSQICLFNAQCLWGCASRVGLCFADGFVVANELFRPTRFYSAELAHCIFINGLSFQETSLGIVVALCCLPIDWYSNVHGGRLWLLGGVLRGCHWQLTVHPRLNFKAFSI